VFENKNFTGKLTKLRLENLVLTKNDITSISNNLSNCRLEIVHCRFPEDLRLPAFPPNFISSISYFTWFPGSLPSQIDNSTMEAFLLLTNLEEIDFFLFGFLPPLLSDQFIGKVAKLNQVSINLGSTAIENSGTLSLLSRLKIDKLELYLNFGVNSPKENMKMLLNSTKDNLKILSIHYNGPLDIDIVESIGRCKIKSLDFFPRDRPSNFEFLKVLANDVPIKNSLEEFSLIMHMGDVQNTVGVALDVLKNFTRLRKISLALFCLVPKVDELLEVFKKHLTGNILYLDLKSRSFYNDLPALIKKIKDVKIDDLRIRELITKEHKGRY
jgi:hypothetical protein